MTVLDSTALRIAYCAVKSQLTKADKSDAWFDASMRDTYSRVVRDLEKLLREADREKEIAARGGNKQKIV